MALKTRAFSKNSPTGLRCAYNALALTREDFEELRSFARSERRSVWNLFAGSETAKSMISEIMRTEPANWAWS
jgi:hypothetical protein